MLMCVTRVARSSVVVKVAPGAATMSSPSSAKFSDWWTLSKGYLSVWVALSALPGYVLAATGAVDPVGITGVLAGTALASASSQALNQEIESSRDSVMKRTKNRPIPNKRISHDEAKTFAAVSALSGCAVLTAVTGGTSLAPSLIALSTIGLYVKVYTPMKTRSPYNTHVGAVAGSLPVMIGYACAGGFPVFLSPEPWILLALQTIWQFPHFYPLAWMYKEDYKEGNYRMFPLTDETGQKTANMCFPYMVALGLLPFGAAAFGATSWMYPVTATAINALYGKTYWSFYMSPSRKTARTFFLGSLWYLILSLGAFVAHVKPMHDSDWRTQIKQKLKALCLHESIVSDCHVHALCPAVDNSRKPIDKT